MRKLLLFSLICLLAAGCGSRQVIPLPPPIVQPTPSVYKEGAPSDILPKQLGVVFTVGNTRYQLVQIPSMNVYLPGLSETLSNEEIAKLWHGVLILRPGSSEWEKFYTIAHLTDADGPLKFNPVGVFEQNSALYIDIVDNRGAGSGEGNLVRLTTTDGGKTWKQTGCYYFTPEKYYSEFSTTGNLARIDPDGLDTNKYCDYK
jgi:hypothetical protein